MLQNLKQKAKDQLVFSSDDSLNSNNSFASSVEDGDKEGTFFGKGGFDLSE